MVGALVCEELERGGLSTQGVHLLGEQLGLLEGDVSVRGPVMCVRRRQRLGEVQRRAREHPPTRFGDGAVAGEELSNEVLGVERRHIREVQ